ncbi:hypothetical protein GCM10010298_01880 [Streptomyces microflavus]|nr:hypothetical protein GCM10010298_01880 [Streptomyces microflavus]
MEAVDSLAMTEWRRGWGGGYGAGTEKVAEVARAPGARSRTRSSSGPGPGSSVPAEGVAAPPSGPPAPLSARTSEGGSGLGPASSPYEGSGVHSAEGSVLKRRTGWKCAGPSETAGLPGPTGLTCGAPASRCRLRPG